MEALLAKITEINSFVNGIVWGPPMLILLLATGIYITVRTKFFQVTRFGHMMKNTIAAVFTDRKIVRTDDKKAISQFQALATALAATVGTGNIVGVAGAIGMGGPGAVFWMWVSAFFGMMTNYSENVLGIYYRHKNAKGEWCGGPMMYIEKGIHQKWLAVVFSVFCLFASFGIGNIAQINSISTSLNKSLSIPQWVTGLVLAALVAVVIIGGIKRIATVTEKLVPFMALFYIIGSLIIICVNFTGIPDAFARIITGAFSFKAVSGGIMGTVIAQAMRYGVARGVFSNEAGLGSSVMVHSSSDVKEPVKQGLWGIFEVFFDTIVICTLTALAILTTGVADGLEIGTSVGAELTMDAFSHGFGAFGATFVSISILLFAFSTILGWSFYGTRAAEYIGGLKFVPVYKVLFTVVVFIGAMSSVRIVWDLSDTFNGLMALPNLVAVLLLSPKIFEITKNYINRVFKGSDEKPLCSCEDEKDGGKN